MGHICEEMQDRAGQQPSVCLAINSSLNGEHADQTAAPQSHHSLEFF